MNQKVERYWLKIRGMFPWIVAAVAVLSANWAADAFLETFNVWTHGEIGVVSWPRIVYIVFFGFMVSLLWWQTKSLFRPHTRYLSNEKAEKRKHLVLFLSSLPKILEKSSGVPKELKLSQDINEDIRVLETLKQGNSTVQGNPPVQGNPSVRWTWEMPLRSIRHHLGILETVTLICSKESISQAHLFLNICKQYSQLKGITFYLLAQKDDQTELICPSSGEPMSSLGGYEFETFDHLSRAIWILLREFKRRGYSDDEIMIDITGGQKPTSVVGASVTFNRKIKVQYVQTNYPWKVISYDFILASADTGGLGI